VKVYQDNVLILLTIKTIKMKVNDIIISAGIIGKITEINGRKVKFVSGYGWNCTADIEFCKLADESEIKRFNNKKTEI
jgi:hypothetical protein